MDEIYHAVPYEGKEGRQEWMIGGEGDSQERSVTSIIAIDILKIAPSRPCGGWKYRYR